MEDRLVCSWNGGRRRGGKDTGCLEDGETKNCQKEVESEGQTRQSEVDGASGSTQLQFNHAGGKRGNKTERDLNSKQTVNPCFHLTFIMMKHCLIIAFHLNTHTHTHTHTSAQCAMSYKGQCYGLQISEEQNFSIC